MARSARTNSRPRYFRNSARVSRAVPVQLTMPIASVTVTSVGENSVTTTIANSSAGSTWKNSVTRISTRVDPAAVVAGEGAERDADQHRQQRGHRADQQRRAAAVDQRGQHVAAEVVGAEPGVFAEGRRQRRGLRISNGSAGVDPRPGDRRPPAPASSIAMPTIADGLRRNMRRASTVGCSTFGTARCAGAAAAGGAEGWRSCSCGLDARVDQPVGQSR